MLYEYLYHNKSAETIADEYPSLPLEAIYGAILYFLQNRPEMESYMVNWLTFAQKARENQKRNPPTVVRRLQELKAERMNPYYEKLCRSVVKRLNKHNSAEKEI